MTPTLEQLFIIINTILVVVLFYLNKRSKRVSTLPYLHVEVKNSRSNPKIVISNQGDVFAMDVDVYALGYIMLDDELGDRQEIHKLVKDLSSLPEPDGEGWIAIRDRLMYSVFPKRKVVAHLSIPKFVDQITVIVQYRDPTGVNYGQSYWFTQGEGRYELQELYPRKLRSSLRRDYIMAMKDKEFQSSRKRRVRFANIFRRFTYWMIWNKFIVWIKPGYLERHDHRILMSHSISAGTLNHKGASIDSYELADRGTWEET